MAMTNILTSSDDIQGADSLGRLVSEDDFSKSHQLMFQIN